MSFFAGLKNLFKKPIFTIIILLFIIAWFLLLIAYAYIPSKKYIYITFQFIGVLGFFAFLLLLVSFIRPIDKLGYVIILILLLLSLTIIFGFENIMTREIFWFFFLISNQILTAGFAFKLCIDSSTKIDDYLYNKKKSRKITRTLEFVVFSILAIFIFWYFWRLFQTFEPPADTASANIFRIMLFVDLILLAFVMLRLLFVQKLAAFIPLFFILTFLYILFIIFDTMAEFLFPITPTYIWFSFLIDLFIFLIIVGSIFDKVDYLKNKLKIFRADTISLFVIIMKLYAQLTKILPIITGNPILNEAVIIVLQFWLLGIFLIFTLLFGLYAIFFHKEGKK
ncbi:MAG: hypothetical protein ACFFHD_02805 [Promethearchaeota archaeon]